MQPVKNPNSHAAPSAAPAQTNPDAAKEEVGRFIGAANRIERIAKQVDGSNPLPTALRSSSESLPTIAAANRRASTIMGHLEAPAANPSKFEAVWATVSKVPAPVSQIQALLQAIWEGVSKAPAAVSTLQATFDSAWADARTSSSAPAAESATQSFGGLGEITKLWDGPIKSLEDLEPGDILLEKFVGDDAHVNISNMHIWLNEIEDGTNGINPNLGDPEITHNAIVTGNGPDGLTVGHAQGNPAKKVIDGPWTPKPDAKYYVFTCKDKTLTVLAARIMQTWASEGKIPYNYEDRSRLTGDAKITPEMAPYYEALLEQAFDPDPKLFGPDESAGLKRGGLTCGEAVVAALAAAAMIKAVLKNPNVDPKTALEGVTAAFPRHLMPGSLHDILIKDVKFVLKGIMTPESMAKLAETQASESSTEVKKKPNE